MEIQNCKFHFECPLHWDDLEEIGTARKRYCGSCGKAVYLVDTHDELQELAERGECVAVSSQENTKNDDEELKLPKLYSSDFPETNSVTMGVYLPQKNLEPPPKPPGLECPKCKTIYPVDSKFCGRCGTSLT